MIKLLKIYGLIVSFAVFNLTNAMGQSFTLSAGSEWKFKIPTSDITEAGDDFSGTYTSNSDESIGNVTGYDYNYCLNYGGCDWEVLIRKEDILWNANLNLYVRRTSGSVSGGISYQLVTNQNQYFFNGNYNRSNINIQYQIRDVSLTIPVNKYKTDVLYTFIDL